MSLPAFALDKLEFEKLRNLLAGYLSTPTGERIIEERIPSADPDVVKRRLDEAAEMMHLMDGSEPPPLETLYDIQEALSRSKVERFVLDGYSLSQIGKWAASARRIRSFFSRHQETTTRLWDIAGGLVAVKELEQHINHTVDEKGEVKPDASPELTRINKRINTQKQAARSTLQRILQQGRETDMIVDEEATLRGGRLVIPVKAEFKRKIKGFIHDTSATGQTVFIEPVEVFDKNNEIRELESARNREIERLLRELTALTGRYSDIMHQNTELIGQIDAVYGCTRLGQRWKGVIPEISGDHSLLLKNCRNPLLLIKHHKYSEGVNNVVPLDLEMEPEEKGIIITGPNAGGKSVTLKTLGFAIALTQYGIPVPAQEGARLPCANGLYIDMGDEQSIDNDLSTFSSRLNWMKQVQSEAKTGSWMLIDEAGSGTDPDEGTALAKAFLEIMAQKKVRSIATTHHGALKIFAHETEGWSNASMEFDQHTLSPTYRFQKGIPGSSYAFEIAERLALPQELTQRARRWVGSGKNKLESLIISLEQESQQLQKRKTEIREQEKSWKTSKDELDKRLSRIKEEREKIHNKAVGEAEQLLKDANRKIEEAIRAASEKDKDTLKQKRNEIEKLDSQIREKQSRRKKKKRKKVTVTESRPPEAGDPVRLIDSNTTGELVAVSGKKATVDVNGLRIKTTYDNLVRSDRRPAAIRSKGYKFSLLSENKEGVRPFSGSLDIRGKRGEEAIREVTQYVDEGLSRGMGQLMIIHGKGDGILRKLVHEHLQSRPDVKHFESAPIEEGGDGCTYVFL